MSKPTNRVSFTVTLDLPESMTLGQMRQILHNAIISEPGAHPPEDPMHHLNRETVRVTWGMPAIRIKRPELSV